MKISNILQCIACKGELIGKKGLVVCKKCQRGYPLINGVINFNLQKDITTKNYENFQQNDDPYNFISAPLIVKKGHKLKERIISNLCSQLGISNKLVLDLGSGQGINKSLAAAKFLIVEDISINALLKSRKKNKSLKKGVYITAKDVLPCRDGSIDVIFAGEVIEHVQDVRLFLQECFRVLNRKGKMIITTPNKNAIIYSILGFSYSKCLQHISLMGYNELIPKLSEYFVIKKSFGINQSFFHYIDKVLKNHAIVKWWSQIFLNKPHFATGLVIVCEKK